MHQSADTGVKGGRRTALRLRLNDQCDVVLGGTNRFRTGGTLAKVRVDRRAFVVRKCAERIERGAIINVLVRHKRSLALRAVDSKAEPSFRRPCLMRLLIVPSGS